MARLLKTISISALIFFSINSYCQLKPYLSANVGAAISPDFFAGGNAGIEYGRAFVAADARAYWLLNRTVSVGLITGIAAIIEDAEEKCKWYIIAGAYADRSQIGTNKEMKGNSFMYGIRHQQHHIYWEITRQQGVFCFGIGWKFGAMY